MLQVLLEILGGHQQVIDVAICEVEALENLIYFALEGLQAVRMPSLRIQMSSSEVEFGWKFTPNLFLKILFSHAASTNSPGCERSGIGAQLFVHLADGNLHTVSIHRFSLL